MGINLYCFARRPFQWSAHDERNTHIYIYIYEINGHATKFIPYLLCDVLTHAAAVVETLLINLFIGKLNNCFHLLVSKISYEEPNARREPNQISNRNAHTHTHT